MKVITNSKVKTRYSTLIPKGVIGKVVGFNVDSFTGLTLVKVEFKNGECFWFLKRDLEEVEE
jgi:hypothetical protein